MINICHRRHRYHLFELEFLLLLLTQIAVLPILKPSVGTIQ